MSEKYCKLSADLPYSSMWQEDGDTCKFWITLLCLKNEEGVVTQNLHGVARQIQIPYKKCIEALEKFKKPDPQSKTPEDDGRRVEIVPGGIKIINHEKYQQLGWTEEKRKYERERKAKQREKKKLQSG